MIFSSLSLVVSDLWLIKFLVDELLESSLLLLDINYNDEIFVLNWVLLVIVKYTTKRLI